MVDVGVGFKAVEEHFGIEGDFGGGDQGVVGLLEESLEGVDEGVTEFGG